MGALTAVQCVACGHPYPENGFLFRCPVCGGLFDYSALPPFDFLKIDQQLPGIWRYRHTFGLPADVPVLSLGEGNTPLVQDKYQGMDFNLKLEYMNPSGSYKDRAMAVIMAHVLSRGIKTAVEDSSGNAGASFAVYAARADIAGTVFVPAHLSEAKARQIEIYGAQLQRIPGPRSAAADAVMEQAQKGAAYASHAYLPFGKRGIATMAYEIWSQSDQHAPGTIIAPVGHGHLLMGIIEGFEVLKQSGYIRKVPYYVGVQAAACPPIYDAWVKGGNEASSVVERTTLAEGVSVSTPRQAEKLLAYMKGNGGRFHAASEDDILIAFHELAERGFYVEHTSALVWDAMKQLLYELPRPITLILTGSGLKTTIEL